MKTIDGLFGFAKLQDTINILNEMVEKDLTFDDLIAYVEMKKEEFTKAANGDGNQPTCPECGHPLNLLALNTAPGNQTGDDNKSVWECVKCYWQKYNKETPLEMADMLAKEEA